MFGQVPQVPWKDEENQALIRLVNEGRTASNIGLILHKTRSAVIGRARRMGLQLLGGSNRDGTGSGYRYWTPERIAELEKLYFSPLGYSRDELAQQLSIGLCLLSTGIRNIRKAHNMRRAARKVAAAPRKRHAPRPPDNMTDLPAERCAHPRTFISLERGMCRWPVSGSGADMMCCAGEAVPFGSYCVDHAKRAYRWD